MVTFLRHDGRSADELRPVRIVPDFVGTADGSCLIEVGRTRVVCTAGIVQELPRWRHETGQGWVTAEYGMLPGATPQRKGRPIGRPDSRSVEIQRLIGRVLRSVVRLDRIGPRTVYLDCDVLEADGGTRAAAVTGAYVALARAARRGEGDGRFIAGVLRGSVAAVSVGLVAGRCLLDLDYAEDSRAEVDMNVAMTGSGRLVEVQAAAEGRAFSETELRKLLALARRGVRRLVEVQRKAIQARAKR